MTRGFADKFYLFARKNYYVINSISTTKKLNDMSQTLQDERKKVSFDLRELGVYIYDNEERYKHMMDSYKLLAEDPILRNDVSTLGKSRVELFKIYAEKTVRLDQLFNIMDYDCTVFSNHFSNQVLGTVSAYMFLPYIRHLGSDKQLQKWVPRIYKGEVIGSYVQTELGHGSDLRSLETTAILDLETDEFVINSPTLTSTKFWPGDLGITANHVVCMAQLIIKGENKGVHGFIVPIRDIETHKPLPGIEVGDIGEKVGYNTKDNGYCRFDNIRIPRDNMLNKYIKVSKSGEYKRRGDEKIGYAIMMQIRDMIGHLSWRGLSQACLISTRYSLVRTQFANDEGVERKIFDYQIQQDKIIPLIAATYAMHAGAKKATALTQQNLRNIQEREDFSLMKDLHATLCAVKAFYSYETDAGINRARQSCGGHGYSSFSGFTTLWREFSPNVTYEGENTVMILQTARYLVTCLEKLRKGSQLQDNVAYLKNLQEILSIKKCAAKRASDYDMNVLFDVIQANAAIVIYRAGKALMKGAQEGGFKDSWDKKAGISLIEAARGHTLVYTFRAFAEKIDAEIASPQLKIVLQRLCMLYGIEKILEHPLGLVESEYLSSKQFVWLRQRKEELLEEIRPDAIGLVDAFGYPDNTIRSALGVYDGNVYEALMKNVRENNEFNKHDLTETMQKYIKELRQMNRPLPKL